MSRRSSPSASTRASALRLKLGAREAVVFSYALDDSTRPVLSRGEHHVFLLLLSGFRAQEIANLRDTTLRTVTKQIEAVYRKLQVTSRAELAQRYSLTSFSPAGRENAPGESTAPAKSRRASGSRGK